MPELVGHVRIRVDLFECVVLLQLEKFPKFVDCATSIRGTSLSRKHSREQQFHERACSMPRIDMARRHFGTFLAPKAPATDLQHRNGALRKKRTCHLLDACLHDFDQIIVIEHPIGSTLQMCKRPLHWILRHVLLVLPQAYHELSQIDMFRFLAEQLLVDVFGPFLVDLANARVPPIAKVEFC